jgi:hypothetical protein
MTLEEEKTFASRVGGVVVGFLAWGLIVLVIVWLFG